MGKSVYNIAEIANVHGGDFNYLHKIVEEFSSVKGMNGIKFQPFHYDRIALPDYKWYPVYKELFFTNAQWKEIISLTAKKADVWVDTDDDYSTTIIKENIGSIFGIKLQSSILYNEVVFNELKNIGLKGKELILNVSGIEIDEIKKTTEKFLSDLNPGKLILQVGYQGYPTKLEEGALSKIAELKKAFSFPISYADHIDGKSEEIFLLPLMALGLGAEYIEKHILLEDRETKYDFYSSITKAQFEKLIDLENKVLKTLHDPFIIPSEKKYLDDSQQIPVAKQAIKAGSIISINDLEFKRSNAVGLTVPEIMERTKQGYVVADNIGAHEVIPAEKMKKAVVAAVIACRLKSSRLKRKAVLNIGNISSVEMCIKTTMELQNVNHVVLATSDLEEDAELEKYTYAPSVIFHKGDPLDVIQRYVGILDELRADVLVRITADMPYVSNEITAYLLKEHFAHGADLTSAIDFAVGTAPQIMNVSALREIKKYFPKADYSEYMTAYFTNNPTHFKVHEVKLPDEMVRKYRLTLDYEEDLILFNKIESHLQENNHPHSLAAIFDYLDKNPDVAKINANITLAYKSDEDLINRINEHSTIKS